MKRRPLITNLASAGGMPERLRVAWNEARVIARPQAAASDLLLYDRIGPDYWDGGGLTHQFVADWLAALPADTKEITVRINSPGGDVFEGIGIYNALVTWSSAQDDRRITVRIDAVAASIASVIACCGDEIRIAGNGMVMIHPASTMTWGTAADHRSTAGVLDTIDATILQTYVARTDGKEAEIKAWMDAETYMTAAEAVARGFADKADDLKGKPAPAPEPDTAPDNRASAANLAAARLIQAKALQKTVTTRLQSAAA